MKRVKSFFTAFLAVVFFCAPHAQAADAQKLEKLVIGYPAPVASLGIIEVMRRAGLFKKNGLDVDLVYIQGSPILTTAMVSGVGMPCAASASYCATLLSSSCSARRPFTTVRPWRSSVSITAAAYSGA